MKKLYIEEGNINKIALTKDDKLKNFYIKSDNNDVKSGDIIVGVIKNKVSQLDALFIDIGDNKNAFMEIKNNYDDYIVGKEILVEVLYKENSKKGFKVTDKISLGGESVVLFLGDGIAFSKKLDIKQFQEKHGDFSQIEKYRILFRALSINFEREFIEKEIEMLEHLLDKIIKKSKVIKGPYRIYESKSSIERIIRKNYDGSLVIYTNSEEIYNRILENYDLKAIYSPDNSLLKLGIEDKVLKLLDNKIILDNGSNIVIEKTEAMHVIDVNSSEFKGNNKNIANAEDFAFNVNKESLDTIVNEIKLRNLSGIIIIDFLSMKSKKNKKEIFNTFNELVKKEDISFKAYPLSRNSLMEIIREKRGEEIYDVLSYKFPHTSFLLDKKYLVSLIISNIKNTIFDIKVEKELNYLIHLNFLYKDYLDDIDLLLKKEISTNYLIKDRKFNYSFNLKRNIKYYDIEIIF